jgi:lipoprotein-anchoring transpeptidase ErfK/SrfK
MSPHTPTRLLHSLIILLPLVLGLSYVPVALAEPEPTVESETPVTPDSNHAVDPGQPSGSGEFKQAAPGAAPDAATPDGAAQDTAQENVKPESEGAETPDDAAAAEDGGAGENAEAKPEGDAANQNAAEQAAPEQKAEDQTLKDDRGNAMAPDTSNEESGSKVVVNIDKSTQRMTVFVDGIETYSWPVSTGLRGYSTPSGEYTASSMNEIWYSKQWDNAPMPHAIFFTKKGHAIHGTLDEKNLGKAASHGCVRLSRANAKMLFALVKEKGLKNTQVVLSGETPGGEYKMADRPKGYQQYGDVPPWMQQAPGYYYPPRERRGLFGRRFFQPDARQGYYQPPRGYYYQQRRY